jgi:hypothetical protein
VAKLVDVGDGVEVLGVSDELVDVTGGSGLVFVLCGAGNTVVGDSVTGGIISDLQLEISKTKNRRKYCLFFIYCLLYFHHYAAFHRVA